MKHQTFEQLQRAAVVHPDQMPSPMPRRERLERWAELLDREPGRRLSTFPGTEWQGRAARDAIQMPGSPVSIAFRDPIFRAQGLTGETYGDARRFFELTDGQLHRIVCYCHHGETMTARTAARYVRAAISKSSSQRSGWFLGAFLE
jgi:hypothetical protein